MSLYWVISPSLILVPRIDEHMATSTATLDHTPVSEDQVHALGDLIEHIQTRWEADRDQYSEPLADYTARALIAAGVRMPVEPKLQYGVRSVVNLAHVRAGTEQSTREAAARFPERWTLVARTPGTYPGPWAAVTESAPR